MTEELNENELALRKVQISRQACFANLNPAEMDVLATLLKETHFQPGDIIVNEGERVDSVFLIVQGSADVIRSSRENNATVNTTVATLDDGDAIGLSEHGFYSLTGQRTATVVATSLMNTLKLSVTLFRGFALAYPHASQVMREQSERL
jgi:CRP-like cAMP-binding protein